MAWQKYGKVIVDLCWTVFLYFSRQLSGIGEGDVPVAGDIEGPGVTRDLTADTGIRIEGEGNHHTLNRKWWKICGTLEFRIKFQLIQQIIFSMKWDLCIRIIKIHGHRCKKKLDFVNSIMYFKTFMIVYLIIWIVFLIHRSYSPRRASGPLPAGPVGPPMQYPSHPGAPMATTSWVPNTLW